MQGPGSKRGLSIGFDAFLLFKTNIVLLFRVSLCLCTPGQNSGISNTVRSRYKRIVYKRIWVASLPFQPVWATFFFVLSRISCLL